LLLTEHADTAAHWTARRTGASRDTLETVTAFDTNRGIHAAQDLTAWLRAQATPDSGLAGRLRMRGVVVGRALGRWSHTRASRRQPNKP